MRHLLAAMRDDDDDVELGPSPASTPSTRCVEEVERAGLPVRLEVVGEPAPLPRALDLSATASCKRA